MDKTCDNCGEQVKVMIEDKFCGQNCANEYAGKGQE